MKNVLRPAVNVRNMRAENVQNRKEISQGQDRGGSNLMVIVRHRINIELCTTTAHRFNWSIARFLHGQDEMCSC